MHFYEVQRCQVMRSVLVVDDEEDVRNAMMEFLLRRYPGVTVLTAENARGGKEVMAELPIDVLIVDYRLPYQSGLRVLEAASRLGVPPRCILMTGFPDMGVVKAASKRGYIEGFLVKPFNGSDLAALIDVMRCSRGGDPRRRILRSQLEQAIHGLETQHPKTSRAKPSGSSSHPLRAPTRT